jgi:hypothetical protein
MEPVEPLKRYIAKSILTSLGLNLRSLPDCTVFNDSIESFLQSSRIHPLSMMLINDANKTAIREKRIEAYRRIELLLDRYNFAYLPLKLDEGNSPMAFPVYVESSEHWLRILQSARRDKFDIHTWPNLPHSVRENDQYGSVARWQRLLMLPLHQELDMDAYLLRLEDIFNNA